MSLELFNTLASVGTFVVIAATAIAAMIQLRHMRRNNQLQAVFALRNERATKELDDAFHFVSTEFAAKLEDPHFRAELETAVSPSRRVHKELLMADYFEHVGTYIKRGLVDEDVYFEIGSPERFWNLVAPALAIYRRRRSPQAYENFEYLVARAQEWEKAHEDRTYPTGTRRLPLEDIYAAADSEHPHSE